MLQYRDDSPINQWRYVTCAVIISKYNCADMYVEEISKDIVVGERKTQLNQQRNLDKLSNKTSKVYRESQRI
jgi:hypothetical protein